jgi:hypothetical protein
MTRLGFPMNASGYTSTEILLLIFLNFSKVFKHVSEKLLLDRIHIQISYKSREDEMTRRSCWFDPGAAGRKLQNAEEMKMSISLRRKWLALIVCGKIAAACCVFGADSNESKPRVSVGIKVGAPMTRFLTFDLGPGTDAQTKRYTVGPVMDIALPRGLGVEVGAMYKHIDEQGFSATLLSIVDTDEGPAANYRYNHVSTVGRSWEFPVAVQYHISLRSMRPYLEGGLSRNRLSNIYGPWPQFIEGAPPPAERLPSLNSVNRRGVLFGGGAEIKLHRIHVTPGLRYTHYSKGNPFLLAPNAVDFLVGFTL